MTSVTLWILWLLTWYALADHGIMPPMPPSVFLFSMLPVAVHSAGECYDRIKAEEDAKPEPTN